MSDEIQSIIVLSVAGYLLGSIPIAWIVAKLVTGKDLRSLGSGNVGVMNVALSVTRWAGLIVFAGEAAKGVLAITLARNLEATEVGIGAAVLATVIGTRWMIWLGFAGGRGNTAGIAAMLLLSWQTLAVGFGIWIAVRLLTRSSFWATRICMFTWPFVFGWLTESPIYLLFGIALSAIYLTTHQTVSDDHSIIKQRWPSLWAFLVGPKRRREP
jgi:glycerol-3-phosphate acyltransferase PlsY